MFKRVLPLLLLLVPALAHAQAERQPLMYLVEDDDSRVYLFGSVHLLDEDAYPLPDYVEAAYDDAELLAFEIDLNNVEAMQQTMAQRALLTDGATLEGVLPAETYARLDSVLADLGVPVVAFAQVKPWAVSLSLAQLAMQRFGYTGEHGVDLHFVARAQADEKERLALETLESQLAIFDNLSMEEQAAYLSDTLADWDDTEAMIERLITAWSTGDEAELNDLMNDLPESMRPLLLRDRNAAWTPQIEAMLAREGEDVMVVVGAGHLVGADSVVEMLRAHGYTVTRQ